MVALASRRLSLAIAISFLNRLNAFVPITFSTSQTATRTYLAEDDILECSAPDERVLADRLKRELFQLGASYDRGFGASPSSRTMVLSVIEDLERCNEESNASRGISGNETSPLTGSWRMVWTTAVDVLSLQASPFFTAGAIYQVFEPPIVTNIIDFLPRLQALLPPNVIPNSLLRAKVQTRASPREGLPNRIGLVFESIKLEPKQILGMDIDIFPPIGWDLPTLPGMGNSADSPGYFDTTYLDDELLIIRQNAPGGLFALVKVDSTDP